MDVEMNKIRMLHAVSILPVTALRKRIPDFTLSDPFIILISAEIARGKSGMENAREAIEFEVGKKG